MCVSCRSEQPPASASSAVQVILNRAACASLSRSVLSRGIQHPSPLVQYTTLSTLLKVLRSLGTVLHDMQAALGFMARQTDSQTDDTMATAVAMPPALLLPTGEQPPVGSALGHGGLTDDEYLMQYAASAAAALQQAQQQQSLSSRHDGASQSKESSLP